MSASRPVVSSKLDGARTPRKRASAVRKTRKAPADSSGAAAAPREEMIRTAAYLRAERRGFAPGAEVEDWLEAEREIDRWIETRGAPHRYRCPPK